MHDQRDRKRRPGEMSGELAALRQRRQGRPVFDDDQVPGLGVLGRPGPSTGVEDVEQDVIGDLTIGKLAHGPKRSNQLSFAHQSQSIGLLY